MLGEGQRACVGYLGWVDQVEGLVEAEVDEPQKGCIHLCERGHDSVVHICGMLPERERAVRDTGHPTWPTTCAPENTLSEN